MFEKIKEKSKRMKNWIVRNKTELAYAAGCAVGMVVTSAVFVYDDNKKTEVNLKRFPNEDKILSNKQYADYYDAYGGPGTITLSELSDKLISNGGVADSKVIGALVYTKK